MPNTLTTAQLRTAQSMITSGNVTGFYNYMAGQGYGYANLALGVVQCSFLSGGSTAQNYMVIQAAQMGITLTPSQVGAIEVNMANQYINTLIGLSQARATDGSVVGVVSRDWNYNEALTGHNAGFTALSLPPGLWTLYAPSQFLTTAQL